MNKFILSKKFSLLLKKSIQSEIGWLFVDEREATFGHIQQNKPVILKKYTYGINLNHRADVPLQKKTRLLKEANMAFHLRIFKVMNEFFNRFEVVKRIFIGGSNPIEKFVKYRIVGSKFGEKITFIAVSGEKGRAGIQNFFKEIKKILSK